MAMNSAEDGGVADLAKPEGEGRKLSSEKVDATAPFHHGGAARAVGRYDQRRPTADRFGNEVIA